MARLSAEERVVLRANGRLAAEGVRAFREVLQVMTSCLQSNVQARDCMDAYR